MLALLGALKEEISDLRREMVIREIINQTGCKLYRGKYQNRDILLVQTGLGKGRAESATKHILEHYPITTLISLGFAGALADDLNIGDVIICCTLHRANGWMQQDLNSEPLCSDARLVTLITEALGDAVVRFRCGSIVTVPLPVSSPEAKRDLGKSCRVQVVDMESYWIARIASAKRVPFMAVRTISDTVRDSLPPFDQILDSNGTWHWNRAVHYFVVHPQHLVKLFALYRNAQQARRSLTIIGRLAAKI